jgi:hypothetical protein
MLLPIFFGFFLCVFFLLFLIHYAVDVYALVSCLFIVMCCLFLVMVENTDDDPDETKPIFVKNSEISNHLRLKTNQILMELPFMLKLHYMLTLVSSHLMPTKLTQLILFSKKLNGKIGMICLIGYVVKQIGRDLQLLHIDPI